MNDKTRLSPLGAEMVEGLSGFRDALRSGDPIETRYTVRTVKLELHKTPYTPADVKRVRLNLGASQADFAIFLGVSVKTLRSWEQGTRNIPGLACRFLDRIVADPNIWNGWIQETVTSAGPETIDS